jgi:hypothetical protein
MQLTTLMAMTLRMSSVAENNLNSVERVCEYSDLPYEVMIDFTTQCASGGPACVAVNVFAALWCPLSLSCYIAVRGDGFRFYESVPVALLRCGVALLPSFFSFQLGGTGCASTCGLPHKGW